MAKTSYKQNHLKEKYMTPQETYNKEKRESLVSSVKKKKKKNLQALYGWVGGM